jgi:hypothetical protein
LPVTRKFLLRLGCRKNGSLGEDIGAEISITRSCLGLKTDIHQPLDAYGYLGYG